MANQQQHALLIKEGVKAWNQWRKEHPDLRPDLSGIGLIQANLSRADLSRADLRGARLSRVDLSEAE